MFFNSIQNIYFLYFPTKWERIQPVHTWYDKYQSLFQVYLLGHLIHFPNNNRQYIFGVRHNQIKYFLHSFKEQRKYFLAKMHNMSQPIYWFFLRILQNIIVVCLPSNILIFKYRLNEENSINIMMRFHKKYILHGLRQMVQDPFLLRNSNIWLNIQHNFF
jgi:hypothetical protein